MTAISSRHIQRHVSKFRLVNKVQSNSTITQEKPFITKVRYDKEGRRFVDYVKSEPRVLLQLKREELKEQELQLMRKLEKLRRIRDALRRNTIGESDKDCVDSHTDIKAMNSSSESC